MSLTWNLGGFFSPVQGERSRQTRQSRPGFLEKNVKVAWEKNVKSTSNCVYPSLPYPVSSSALPISINLVYFLLISLSLWFFHGCIPSFSVWCPRLDVYLAMGQKDQHTKIDHPLLLTFDRKKHICYYCLKRIYLFLIYLVAICDNFAGPWMVLQWLDP
jgi:hypothetical protein